ncbi:MAG TPA: YhfC family glutamic-type intramembrane protease, partial [Patescibacteria group bacterium]|nr:YhfC family glutamic-type intramembrane protease [Patescibacteria group bacterium]
MVNNLSIAFMIVTLLICFLLPAALVVYFYKRHKISLIAVLWGAIVFLVSQVATRIPLLTILGKQQWYMEMSSNIYLIALFLGLTAGLFEEVGRYIVMKFFMKKSLSWKSGIAFGIGHGGIEAMVIVGLTILNYLIMSFMINSGVFESMIAANLPQGVAEQIKSMLVDTPAINFLAGGFERIMTMIIQIAFSVIVLYSVKFKKPVYLLYAILLHA